jgi:glucosamine--fructose-6-phosphate aminotransferase (isomerizing)
MDRGGDFVDSCKRAFSKLEGNYAILAIHEGDNYIVASRKGSPLVVGVAKNGYFAASDIPAFLEHTKDIVYLYENDFVVMGEGITFYNLKEGPVIRKIYTVDWDVEQAKKGEFEHFMLKEISEQVDTVKKAIQQDKEIVEKICDAIKTSKGIFFVACGSSYHACLSSSYVFSKVAGIHVNVVLGSEFPNYTHFLNENSLIIAVSQSGETADVLEAVKEAKKKGSKVISIVNVMGSSLTHHSDEFLLLNAGPEICVLSTKTYTSQLALLTLIAYSLAEDYETGKDKLEFLWNVIYYLTSANMRDSLKKLSERLKDTDHLFTIGRGLQYPTAMEAALKIKEVSYIHAEAFAGGELKHGTIALIEKGTPCIVFVGEGNEKEILSNAMEIKSRGGYIIGVAEKNNEIFDFFIKVPGANCMSPIIQIIPIQILSYQLAVLRGCDPDKPRNLAKSVTVK